jgi:hypothetical protein
MPGLFLSYARKDGEIKAAKIQWRSHNAGRQASGFRID